MIKQVLFVSPHYDDAVLSAAPLMLKEKEQGNQVILLTVFGGFSSEFISSWGQELHEKWGFSSIEEAVKERALENKNSVELLGVSSIDLRFNDFIYREESEEIEEQLREELKKFYSVDKVYFLSATGNTHPDHVLVSRVVREVFKWNKTFCYYFFSVSDSEKTEHNVLTNFYAKITFREFLTWVKAIKCYESQIDDLFGSTTEMVVTFLKIWLKRFIKYSEVY